ncbi:phosphoadenosine phosphosulfate reductase family protein [Vibrio harveyi]|uniref:phosphoadenosine phosphosulfate reductase family protein n=1 Tax=Vibrio harveyi TaxID=669 RepID=UPI001EFDD3DC|nr:phosphoadenosine phosphosulfate reductase family protein [Vibrio harveyi]MCG9670333.1 phosphoadenosine phosphosulfate reductase family protein [Vibrio harveyi]
MMNEQIEVAIEKIQSLLRSGFHLATGWSGGKDSTCVLILMLEAIQRMKANGEHIPKCYVSNANTRREMPAMDNYLAGVMGGLQMYIAKQSLNVELLEITPSLSGRFLWTTIGRGKLPRWVGMGRDCAVDEKIRPQQRAMKQVERECNGKVISLLGTRFSESKVRESSMKSHQMDQVTIVEIDGARTFSVIADWELDDVWDLLTGCSSYDGRVPRYFPSFIPHFSELSDLYKDANDGVCGVIIGDSGNRGGCGSRFGCAWCVQVGDRDKSLESLISEDSNKYGYMSGLVKFRQFLINIRYDMSRRDFRGRTVSEAGYMKVVADYLSPSTKRELLRFLMTLDALEVERARKAEEDYYSGRLEQNEYNLMLTEPMFEFVTKDDVLSVDFCWSMGRDFPHEASPAARDYIDIHELGTRYYIPKIPEREKVSIPKPRWFNVNEAITNVEGLNGLIASNGSLQQMQLHSADQLEIEPLAGWSYIEAVRRNYYDLKDTCCSEICRAALHYGWIKMRVADLTRYDEIARRNDYLMKLMKKEVRLGICPYSGDDKLLTVNEFIIENSISDKEHQSLLKEVERKRILEAEQSDLFGADSILDMLDVPQKKVKREKEIKTDSVLLYQQMESQMPMFAH